jgi:hypothetical protein
VLAVLGDEVPAAAEAADLVAARIAAGVLHADLVTDHAPFAFVVLALVAVELIGSVAAPHRPAVTGGGMAALHERLGGRAERVLG